MTESVNLAHRRHFAKKESNNYKHQAMEVEALIMSSDDEID